MYVYPITFFVLYFTENFSHVVHIVFLLIAGSIMSYFAHCKMGYKYGFLLITIIGLALNIYIYVTQANNRAKKWFWLSLMGVLGFNVYFFSRLFLPVPDAIKGFSIDGMCIVLSFD